VFSAHTGLDLSLGRSLVLRTGFAYDAFTYKNTVANGSLDGYALEAGLIVRL
jgi:hypothetical protein